MVPQIVDQPNPKRKEYIGPKENYLYINDEVLVGREPEYITALWGGVIILIMYTFLEVKWTFMETFVFILCCLLVITFTAYYFMMTEKKQILNRKQGTITFMGFMWAENFTMRLDEARLIGSRWNDRNVPGPHTIGCGATGLAGHAGTVWP
jgi:hypothetical protein